MGPHQHRFLKFQILAVGTVKKIKLALYQETALIFLVLNLVTKTTAHANNLYKPQCTTFGIHTNFFL